MRRSKLRGVRKVSAVLKNAPAQVERRVQQEIAQGADDILLDMRGLVPKRSGDLAHALKRSVSKGGLSAKIGLLSRKDYMDHFYWLYLEHGTKGDPDRNIPPLPASPFVGPAFDINEPIIAARISRATLGVLSAGGGWKVKRK